ncbi:TetR/AcrR family transcriptional regulator [Niabella drilacis]|uniref:Transcriptional regulator, TetR family n=1 Tax=Niabella drilacis (strain DSM 25811 / CCM 8410 / CCUG 62505 / LMG 26954 / E90) TaxID=1285928 RepID=A0A1G6S994_NIADE|nr:TetR/AcrR family transcriptional regulator [Niabella drilacis]SDD13409.1 transcriptional regulator, TetR family [Niabella drilacis]
MEDENENKSHIRNQALQLFMQYGARSVSMDDIASAVGSSKKTIYQYYTDKDQLVGDAIEQVLIDNGTHCRTFHQISDNAIQEGFLAIGQTSELFRNMNPVLIHDLKKYHPRAYKRFVDYKNEFLYEIIVENIKRGIAEGLYRDDFNIDIIAQFRVGSIDVMFMPEFYGRLQEGLFQVQLELFYFFLHGMATAKGQKLIEKYKKHKPKNNSDAKD